MQRAHKLISARIWKKTGLNLYGITEQYDVQRRYCISIFLPIFFKLLIINESTFFKKTYRERSSIDSNDKEVVLKHYGILQ